MSKYYPGADCEDGYMIRTVKGCDSIDECIRQFNFWSIVSAYNILTCFIDHDNKRTYYSKGDYGWVQLNTIDCKTQVDQG